MDTTAELKRKKSDLDQQLRAVTGKILKVRTSTKEIVRRRRLARQLEDEQRRREREEEDEQLLREREQEDAAFLAEKDLEFEGLIVEEADARTAQECELKIARHQRKQQLRKDILSNRTPSPARERGTGTTATPRANPPGAPSPTVPSTPETLPRPAQAVTAPSGSSPSADLSSPPPVTASPDARSLSDPPGQGAPTHTENRLSAHDNDAPRVIRHKGKSYILWCSHCEEKGSDQPKYRNIIGFRNHLVRTEKRARGTVSQDQVIESYGREIVPTTAGDSIPPHSRAMSPSSEGPSDGQARSASPLLGSNSEGA